jgi:hypothetical protein
VAALLPGAALLADGALSVDAALLGTAGTAVGSGVPLEWDSMVAAVAADAIGTAAMRDTALAIAVLTLSISVESQPSAGANKGRAAALYYVFA